MSAKQKILMSLAMSIIFALALLIILGDHGALDLQRLKEKNQQLVKQNALLAHENLKLARQIQRLKNDHAYIENIARRELGMIKADEVILKPSGAKKRE